MWFVPSFLVDVYISSAIFPSPGFLGKKPSAKEAKEDQTSDVDELDNDVAEIDLETAEKENEDCSNIAANKAAKQTRKRVKKIEGEEQEEGEPGSAEKQDGVKKKRQKKTANGEDLCSSEWNMIL